MRNPFKRKESNFESVRMGGGIHDVGIIKGENESHRFDNVQINHYYTDVAESMPYMKSLTVDQTTSTQGEYPPINIDTLIEYRRVIPHVDTAVEFYKDFIIGNDIVFNANDDEAINILEEFVMNTDFHERLRNVVDMMLITGLGLFLIVRKNGKIMALEDFDISSIHRVNRDKYGNAVQIEQRLPNSGVQPVKPVSDFVRLVIRPQFRQFYGRSVFESLATTPISRGRVMPPIGERILGMFDALFGSVENFAHPLIFLSTEGMSDLEKKEFRSKIAKRKPGDMFIGDEIPQMQQMKVDTHANYDAFIQEIRKLYDHGLGMPLDVLQGDFANKSSAETTDTMFMRKIRNYQKTISRMLVNDVFLKILEEHESGKWITEESRRELGLRMEFNVATPTKYAPEQVAERVEKGIWTVKEAREYDKKEGLDLKDDEGIEKIQQEEDKMKDAEIKQMEAPKPALNNKKM